MPNGSQVETFSAPIEGVIAALGRGVAEAQAELDRSSARAQAELDADPVLSRLGTQATWFQLPQVDLELRISMTVTRDPQSLRPLRLIAQPVSAKFKNHFDYTTEASSLVRLTIVPVPPPRAGDPATVPARLSTEEVRKLAFDSAAGFKDDPNLRLDVNFNAASRVWYVLQYDPADPADPAGKAVVASVDDETGTVRVISG
jgi:hypothetical protein